MPSGSHSVRHQAHSPSASVRTTLTAPDPSSFHRPSVHQNSRSPSDSNIDPNLPNFSLLTPSPYNPIARHFQDQPWSAGNLRSSSVASGRSSFNHSGVQYGIYRGSPGSDMDSNVLASDSGYHSQRPPSVFSNEPSRNSQEIPSSTTLKAINISVEPNPSEALALQPMPSDQASQASSRSGKSGGSFQCPECGEMSKCKSDLKCVRKFFAQSLDANTQQTGSTNLGTTDPSSALYLIVNGPRLAASLQSMISIDTKKVYIG